MSGCEREREMKTSSIVTCFEVVTLSDSSDMFDTTDHLLADPSVCLGVTALSVIPKSVSLSVSIVLSSVRRTRMF